MALEIIESTPELEPGTWDTVWPGDTAVDHDATDVEKWLEHGEMNGIVLNGNDKPTKITCRRLEPDEQRYIGGLLIDGNSGKALVAIRAFQIGVMKIDGLKWVAEERAGVQMMPRKMLNRLMKEEMLLVRTIDGKEKEIPRTLPEAIGEHIFDRSFR